MSDPVYYKYIVEATQQCNYRIYHVLVRHTVSTTGTFMVDRNHNKNYGICNRSFRADQLFDTRAEAVFYAETVLMPKVIEKKQKQLNQLIDYYNKVISKISTSKPKQRFINLVK